MRAIIDRHRPVIDVDVLNAGVSVTGGGLLPRHHAFHLRQERVAPARLAVPAVTEDAPKDRVRPEADDGGCILRPRRP